MWSGCRHVCVQSQCTVIQSETRARALGKRMHACESLNEKSALSAAPHAKNVVYLFHGCEFELAHPVAGESRLFDVNGAIANLNFFSNVNAWMVQRILRNFERHLCYTQLASISGLRKWCHNVWAEGVWKTTTVIRCYYGIVILICSVSDGA